MDAGQVAAGAAGCGIGRQVGRQKNGVGRAAWMCVWVWGAPGGLVVGEEWVSGWLEGCEGRWVGICVGC